MTADAAPGGGFTRSPNWTFDLMPHLTPAEFKVLSAAVRLTYGWNEEWTTATAQEIAGLTGLARPTVAAILADFAAVGLVHREPGRRNSHRWKLCPVSPDDLSSKMTAHKASCNQRLQQPVTSDDSYLSPQMTALYKEERQLKTGKTERRTQAETAPSTSAEQEPAVGSVRTREKVPPAAPPPREPEQPRLVDAEMVDPVQVYRDAAGVKKPNQAQRRAISDRVVGDIDLWREACDRFARNGWNVRNVDNLLDAYDKSVKERRRKERERVEAEERERHTVTTPEQRAENLRILEAARIKYRLFEPKSARAAPGGTA